MRNRRPERFTCDRLRAVAIATGVALLIPLTGCGSGDDDVETADVPSADEPSPDTASKPTPSGNAANIEKCADVEPPPPDTEYDSVLNAESGVLQIYYGVDGVNQEYAIAYKSDPTCQDDPRHREIIEHVLEDAPS